MLTYEDVSPRAYAEAGTSALARSALGVLLEKQGVSARAMRTYCVFAEV